MFNKLQQITKGTISVEEYYQEIEVAIMRVQVEEDSKASIAGFLGGLRCNITHVVDIKEYQDLPKH